MSCIKGRYDQMRGKVVKEYKFDINGDNVGMSRRIQLVTLVLRIWILSSEN